MLPLRRYPKRFSTPSKVGYLPQWSCFDKCAIPFYWEARCGVWKHDRMISFNVYYGKRVGDSITVEFDQEYEPHVSNSTGA